MQQELRDQLQSYHDVRQAVGVMLFFVYLFHYFTLAIVHFKMDYKLKEFRQIEKRLWIYGLVCCMSFTYTQAGVWEAIFCWLSGIVLLLIHTILLLNKDSVSAFKSKIWFVYHTLLGLWMMGNIIHYYTWN